MDGRATLLWGMLPLLSAACGAGRAPAPAVAHPEPTVIERIAFRADSGGPKRLFQPDEHVLAEVELPTPLDAYREFDDDPDIPLLLTVAVEQRYRDGGSNRGMALCTLPRRKLRHRSRFSVAIFGDPGLEPDSSSGLELRVGGTGESRCTDDVRAALERFSRDSAPTVALSVEVTVEYIRSDRSEAPLASGHFDIDLADRAEAVARYQSLLASEDPAGQSGFHLPPQPRPDGEAAILAGMKRLYPDPSYVPIRAVPLAPDWTTWTTRSKSTWASLEVWVEFHRDTGTCVARFFKLESGPYIRKGPPVTAEDPQGRRVLPEQAAFTATRQPERDREMLCDEAP